MCLKNPTNIVLICILQEIEVFCNTDTDKRYIDKNSPYKFIAHVFAWLVTHDVMHQIKGQRTQIS